MGLPEYIGFFYAHTIPEIFTTVEFLCSTIRFEWRRFWLYAIFGVLILVMNIIVTVIDANPYACLDWGEQNQIAIPVGISMLLVQAATFFIVIQVR